MQTYRNVSQRKDLSRIREKKKFVQKIHFFHGGWQPVMWQMARSLHLHVPISIEIGCSIFQWYFILIDYRNSHRQGIRFNDSDTETRGANWWVALRGELVSDNLLERGGVIVLVVDGIRWQRKIIYLLLGGGVSTGNAIPLRFVSVNVSGYFVVYRMQPSLQYFASDTYYTMSKIACVILCSPV